VFVSEDLVDKICVTARERRCRGFGVSHWEMSVLDELSEAPDLRLLVRLQMGFLLQETIYGCGWLEKRYACKKNALVCPTDILLHCNNCCLYLLQLHDCVCTGKKDQVSCKQCLECASYWCSN
jgi:hypothetical protein